VDPIREGGNWYGYVNNNPVIRIDPTGLVTDGKSDASDVAWGKHKQAEFDACVNECRSYVMTTPRVKYIEWSSGVACLIIGAVVGGLLGAIVGAILCYYGAQITLYEMASMVCQGFCTAYEKWDPVKWEENVTWP